MGLSVPLPQEVLAAPHLGRSHNASLGGVCWVLIIPYCFFYRSMELLEGLGGTGG